MADHIPKSSRTLRTRFNRGQSSTAMNYFTSTSYVPHAYQNSSSKDRLSILPSFGKVQQNNAESSQALRAASSSLVGRKSQIQTAAQSPRTSMDITSGFLSSRGGKKLENFDVRVRKSSQMLKRKQLRSGNILTPQSFSPDQQYNNCHSGKTLDTKDTTTQNSSMPKLHLQHPIPRDVESFARDPLDVLVTNDELFGRKKLLTHRNPASPDLRPVANDPNLLRKQAELIQGVEIISDSVEQIEDELNYQFREEDEEERLRRSIHQNRSAAESVNNSQIMQPEMVQVEQQQVRHKKAKKIRMMSPNLKEAYQQDGRSMRVTSPMSTQQKASKMRRPLKQKETQLAKIKLKNNLTSYVNQISQANGGGRKSSKESHSKKRKLQFLSPRGELDQQFQNPRVSFVTNSPRMSFTQEQFTVPVESNFELARKLQKMELELKQEEKDIKKFQLKKAQAESDKIEVMRDIATYEANACDAVDVKGIFTAMHNLVKQTKFKVNSLNGQKDQFLQTLYEKVSHGVNQIQEIASGMKHSQHLIQTKRGIKRLDATKRAGYGPKRSSAAVMMGNSTSVETAGKRKGRDVEIEFFTQLISEHNCSLRVKMKELTYNITCSPMVDLREPHTNMKIKIKRGDNDSMIEDARQYMKKLIILVNRSKQPMLYYANDLNKYPKSNFWHVLYKLKQDERCPFVTLRIISKKGEFGKQNMIIQVLDFLPGGAAHERLVNLQKVKIISESTVVVPMKAKTQIMYNQLPLDLTKLLIKRKSKDAFDFAIHYHSIDFDIDDLRSKDVTELYNKLKPSRDQFNAKRGSLPDDRFFSSMVTQKDRSAPPKPVVHKASSTVSRRATVNDAIPVTQRLLDKEHMEILSNIDSQEEDQSEGEQMDKLKKMINTEAYKIEFASQAPVINNSNKRKTRKSKFFQQEDLINLAMVQKDMYMHSKTKQQGIIEESEEVSNSRNSKAESKQDLLPKPNALMRFSTLFNIHLDPKISPLRPLNAFAKALSGSQHSLDYLGGSDDNSRRDQNYGGNDLIAIDDDGDEDEDDGSGTSLTSSVITPLVKGRYAKHREHWNHMMAKAQPNQRLRSDGGLGEAEEFSIGLHTDDSLLEEDAEKGSEFISDISSEILS